MTALNAFLDRLPRVRVGRAGREAPAFRAAGVAGFHAAVVVTLGGGLRAGLSLLVLALVSAASALSFFGWALLRRRITGRETLVLLEHVWVALGCSIAVLALLGEPVLAYLDVVSVGLGVFLAAGRVGCLLVGCCHGHPSSIGVAYGEGIARDGFSRHLVGIRLFPVQAIESIGLLAASAVGLLMIPAAPPGGVLVWFLAAYAVMRFGLEGLRGDRRPHWLGLSAGRWMAIVELGAALVLAERRRGVLGAAAGASLASLALLLVCVLAIRHARDLAPKLLAPAHVREVREIVRAAASGATSEPTLRRSTRGVNVAVSRPRDAAGIDVSLRLPVGAADLPLLSSVAARALPQIDPTRARLVGDGLLFARLPEAGDAELPTSPTLEDELYGALVRQLQTERVAEPQAPPALEPTLSEPTAPEPPASPPAQSLTDVPEDRRAYFTPSKSPDRVRRGPSTA